MTRSSVAVALFVLLAVQASFASNVKISASGRGESTKLAIHADRQPVVDVLEALAPFLDRPLTLQVSRRVVVSYSRKDVSPRDALKDIVSRAKLMFGATSREYLVRSSDEPTVNLDVKDAPVREILASLQKQCGIRNLIVDPDVQGSGTFLFQDLPCTAALKTVMSTLGLAGQIEPNSLMQVMTADRANRR